MPDGKSNARSEEKSREMESMGMLRSCCRGREVSRECGRGSVRDLIPHVVVLLLVVIGIVLVAPDSRAEDIRVVYTDGRDPERIPVWRVGEIRYLSINDAGRIFDATKQWHSTLKQLILKYAGTQAAPTAPLSATLTVDSPVVLMGDEACRLTSPVRLRKGVIQVPLELVTGVLPKAGGLFARWDPVRRTFRVGPKDLNVLGPIRFKRLARGVRAILTLAEPLAFDFDPDAVGGFKLVLRDGRGDTDRLSVMRRWGPIRQVAATQDGGRLEVLFVGGGSGLEASVETELDPDRIVVDVTQSEDFEVPEPTLKPRWMSAPEEVLDRYGEGRAIDLVVIDPGHGGVDSGARGPSGLEEKDVVLDIARRLEVWLEDGLGVTAVLTREGDDFVPLRSRTEIANSLNADLFISIHCNASRRPDIGGFEVYFQSLEMGEEEELVAEFENAVLSLESGADIRPESDLPFILWDMAQNAFMAESSELGDYVQEALDGRLATKNRGVKQANFVVLRGAHMPAVLIECAFATNEKDETLLNTASFRESVAEGVYEGVARFRRRHRIER